MAAKGNSDGLGPVARTIQLLRVLAEAGSPLSVSELATQLDLPKGSVHRLLQLLREHDIVEADPDSRRYRAGWELFRIGALVASRQPYNDLARPVLAEIVQRCNENCQFGLYLPEQLKMMFVEQAQSSHALRFSIPMYTPQPLLWGCSGRVIVAHLPDKVVDELFATAEPAPATGAAPPDPTRYRRELERIRSEGWDTTGGEKIASSVGFAAPVFNTAGIVGSISITVPTMRYHSYDRDRYVGLVTEAAKRLSYSLGHL